MYQTRDSGEQQHFKSGMRRDTNKGKPRFDLIPISPLRRLAELYLRGAEKYGERNWEEANTEKELERFKASAFRHFIDWCEGTDTGEDEAAATVWNIFAYEETKQKIVNDQIITETIHKTRREMP